MKHQPYLHIIIAILTVGGLLSGILTWLFLPDMLTAELRSYVTTQMYTIGTAISLTESIKAVFCANAIDLMRIYLFGICLAGFPILILFLFLKCFSIGFSFCLLLQPSIVLCLTRLLYVPVLCVAVLTGCRFALQLIQNQIDSPIRRLLQYSVVFAAILIAVLIVSSLDGLSSYYYFTRQ